MMRFSRFLENAVRPRSIDEDRGRREFIFNVLALSALTLLFIAIVDDTLHRIVSDVAMHQADSIASFVLYGLFAFFALLYVLSLRGHALAASFPLLTVIFGLAAYMGYRWGVDVSASLLFYALAITMAGILINARFAFVTAFLVSASIGFTVHLHHTGFMEPDRGWVTELWKADDVLVATIIFFTIALVMWLSNREIEKSLKRARRSEKDLRQERDTLEIRVEERTRELRQAELERMTQAYRFVEFGRMASGIFHDLMNPLAGLTLNIDRIADGSDSRVALSDDVKRAKQAAMHMQDLLLSMRRHLTQDRTLEVFSLTEVVNHVLKLVSTYSQSERVKCSFEADHDRTLYGDPIAFTQVLTNLINNGIQSYSACESKTVSDTSRELQIVLIPDSDRVCLEVRDTGRGIPESVLPFIFEPYFTTKGTEHGIGLGLSLAKRVIEKDFGGTLTVESVEGVGTTFTIDIPAQEL